MRSFWFFDMISSQTFMIATYFIYKRRETQGIDARSELPTPDRETVMQSKIEKEEGGFQPDW